jgi:hemolysin activation/secretion protein
MKSIARAGLSVLASVVSVRAQVGAELQQLEREANRPAVVAPKEDKPAPPALAAPAATPAAPRPAAQAGDAIPAGGLTRVGDISLLKESPAHAAFTTRHAVQPLSIDEIDQAAQAIQTELVKAGYFLARVTVEETEAGKARLAVDGGRIGKVAVYQTEEPYQDLNPAQRKERRQDYDGYFSPEQIRNRLRAVAPGEIFNYNDLHQSLVDANSAPDITINTDLLLRTEEQAADGVKGRRFMDLNLYVDDRLPVHGAVEYKNTGTEGTEEERLIFTLQHLNLTRRDDALTLNVPLSAPDFGVLRALSASYILPFQAGQGGGVSIIGGWSELNARNVVDTVNLDADGWFAGGRVFSRLINSSDYLLNVAAGAVYRSIEENVRYTGLGLTDAGEVQVLPLTLSLIFSNNRPDRLRGRNYLTLMTSYNIGDTLGITDEEDVIAQQPAASPDYWVQRVEASRIQSFGGTFVPRAGTYDGEWYLFGSVEAQYADESLLSVEQMVMGGLETVRGYPERDAIGDRGVGGKLELRSPVLRGPFTKFFVDRKDIEESRRQPVDYLQFVAFADAATVERLPSAGEPKVTTDLFGVGGGLRLSLTKYTQAKLDYGWPLEETATSDDDGRFHFSVQGQF